ncbi:hypothetical protein DRP53_01915 [candidate division WOR-3 bacterium]|uniref:PDZ domain-containing protein n=1 Tax=candidate division WOR-3 bacterium TaxID=2052148 RepID=A0A660SKT8_UNCW3|nr:MAG: hypothetical protein DRP53_01915 [candidate division WOR-3 bacterium]
MEEAVRLIIATVAAFLGGLLLSPLITHPEVKFEERVVTRASKRNEIIEAAQKVADAVVSITVTQTRIYRSEPFLFHDEFFDQFFRDLFPPSYYKKEVRSLGSGVIVSPDGYIITNEHVIRDASRIKVTLPDGRDFDGKVVGSDRGLDIALIKIDGHDLPTAPLGNSDSLVIGEWVVALGNPFGFLLEDHQPTVTVGVISALHRSIRSKGEMVYRDMIQTDAAINPGNSGGPLIDLSGAVVGINTFILTAGGGSEGIGFARPINIIKKKLRELLKGERLTPWLGMAVERREEGMFITQIHPNGPAAKAGLKVGDRIKYFAERRIRGPVDWANFLASIAVGDTLSVVVSRKGRELSTRIIVERMPETEGVRLKRYGIDVAEITTPLIRKYGLAIKKGVVVVAVYPGGLGSRIGLEPGDVILEINGRRIGSVGQLRILTGLHRVAMTINRRGINLRIYFEI